MVLGNGAGLTPGVLTVKGEWDEAERWLVEEEDRPKQGQ